METITLSSGPARVDLFPADGGRIGQIAVAGRELLRGPTHRDAGWSQWGSYPMLPWVNRIPGGITAFEGETITVPVNFADGTAIHGLAAERAWDVVAFDTTTAELAIDLDVDRYRVRATQRFALGDGALDLEIDLVNRAPWRVPAGIGIHPWFVAAPVRVPADLIWEGDGPMPTGPPRPVLAGEDLREPALPPGLDRCWTGLTGAEAAIGALSLSWRGPITQVVVYTGVEGFVCVEPQTMASDGIRLYDEGVDGTGVIALDPDAALTVGYRLAW
jgi:aldose 1-epimerase